MVASTDYLRAFADQIRQWVPGSLPSARHRRLRPQRLPQRAAPVLRGRPPLRRGGRAEGSSPTRVTIDRDARAGGDRALRDRRRGADADDAYERDRRAPSRVEVPDIGDFTDVPVIEILVSPGDTVAVDDPLLTLESDKATMDVPAPFAGTVGELLVNIGDRVSQGTRLLTLSPSSDGDGPGAERPARNKGGRRGRERGGGRGAGGCRPPRPPLQRRLRRPRRPRATAVVPSTRARPSAGSRASSASTCIA